MSLPVLILLAVFMLAVMNAAWLFQRQAGDSGWIDVFWTFGTGIAGAMAALLPTDGAPMRRVIAAAIIAAWAVRLGGYIARRVAAGPEDARYVRYKRQWGARYQRTIYVLIMPQALITAGLCASVAVAAHRPAAVDWRDGLAVLILAIAIAGESLADWQLARFKKTNTKKGAINDHGLWGWSRHPNYFFEWFGWLAWPVMGLDPSAPITWLTLIAPAAMYGVLRYMTGVPPLEQAMALSRGAAFTAYKARTSVFFPLPPRKGAHA